VNTGELDRMKKTIRTIRTIGMLFAVGSAFVTPLHAEPLLQARP
jgi:hypothetical protein